MRDEARRSRIDEEWQIVSAALREHTRSGGKGIADPDGFASWVDSQGREACENVARCAAHWEYHRRKDALHTTREL
jgi:hypothetical protein